MYILSAETSTQKGSVAILKDGQLLEEVQSERQKSHSDILHSLISDLLQNHRLKIEDIDIFAAGLGPGSFTGLRIAGNTMKTFSYALQKPLVAVDSLTLMALDFPEDGIISPWINAYKNMVYWALFEKKGKDLHVLQAPSVIRVQELQKVISQKTWIVGDGFETYEKFIPLDLKSLCQRHQMAWDFPKASTLAYEAYRVAQNSKTIDWKFYQPLYIRSSEAEETKYGILYSSLR